MTVRYIFMVVIGNDIFYVPQEVYIGLKMLVKKRMLEDLITSYRLGFIRKSIGIKLKLMTSVI